MNRTKDYEFTIIVPVYNEAENLERLESELVRYVGTAPVKSCVLLVDDGSTDGSLDMIRRACRRNDGFFYISYGRNSGLSTALKAGIDNTESKYAGYMDADLQTSPEDFNILLRHAGYYHIVSGIRAERRDGFFKRLQSKAANSLRRRITGDKATDTGCPLKVMRTNCARRIPFFEGMHRFLPALFMLEGLRFREVPVRHYPRKAGKSKYHLRNRIKGPLADCLAFVWMKRRYIRYSIKENNL